MTARVPTPSQPLTDAEVAFVRALVLFEDAELLALNKPPGLSSQGARGGARDLEALLAAFARSNGKRPHLAHRLDRDTSGVVLAAKTRPMAGELGRALMARRARKAYLALVERPPEPRQGVVDVPLRREMVGREAYMRCAARDDPEGEAALSRYRTLGAGAGAALLELRPETGRMHQLRVHLAHLGRPILGDPRYGGALTAAGRAVPRLMLHARAIEVPIAGAMRRFEAPPPADMRDLAAAAGVGGLA